MSDRNNNALVVRDIGETRAIQKVEPIMPRTPREVGEFAQFVIETGIVPASYDALPGPKKLGAIVIAIMKGMELGLAPLRSLQSIYVVNGKPTLYGDEIPALLLHSGKMEWFKEGYEGDGDNRFAWFEAKRVGNPEPVRKTFSVADAARMKLLAKPGPWQHSRDRMLMIRARTYLARDLFADVLAGLAIFEEQSDIMRSRGQEPGAFAALPATEDVDPLADEIVVPQITQDEGAIWWGADSELDADSPCRLAPPPQNTKAAWQKYSRALRGLIEATESPGLKLTWWDMNGAALEAQSAEAAKWVREALPADNGEEDDELGDQPSDTGQRTA